jgi:phospholipase C
VPPPRAIPPDAIPPVVEPGEQVYEGFARYGFRVPSVVVSPYARRHHVSHVLYDHTSVLAFVERKWNLPALTYRDANANDLTDFLDAGALETGRPTFPKLPPLAAPWRYIRPAGLLDEWPGNYPAARLHHRLNPSLLTPAGILRPVPR